MYIDIDFFPGEKMIWTTMCSRGVTLHGLWTYVIFGGIKYIMEYNR